MKQRYSLKSNAVKFRLLTLTLLTFVLGGKTAWAQTGYTLTHAGGTKTYYIHTVNTVSAASNNTTASGPQAYKFRVSESSTTPEGDPYDYIERINVTGGTVTFVFLTSKPVGFANTGTGTNQSSFTVSTGTLTLKLDPTNYTSDITLRRVGVDASFENTQNSSVPFHLPNSNGAADAKKIIVEGLPPLESDLVYPASGVENDTATFLAGRQFVIDNAANISSVSLTNGEPTYTGKQASLPIFRVETGTLHLTNVTLQNSINCALGGNAHNGIYVMTSNSNDAGTARNVDVKLTHCWLTKLVSRSTDVAGYPGLGIQYSSKEANGRGDVLVTRCKFSNISSLNGHDSAIRSISSCTAYVTIDRTTVCHNYGGGIRWQGLPAKQPLQIQYSTIKGNYSIVSGGGIMAKAPINLVGSKILNNKAHVNGGGINYMAFDEAGQTVAAAGKIYPKNLSLTMDATTIIDGNEAETGDGGGLYVWGRLINLTANVSPAGNNYIYYEYNDDGVAVGPYMMELNLNGATISNNQAYNNGGGIQIFRDKDASCYLLDCKLNSGTITGNKTLNGNGGGVGITQTETPNPAHVNSDHPARNIMVSTGGGANDLIINENDAKLDGGGIYLYSINDGAGWNEYQKFETIVTLKDRTKIQSNTAYLSQTLDNSGSTDHGGGGLFVQEGNVTIAGTEAAGETNNPLIEANKTKYSGGGICLIKGNIFAEYSRVVSNQATDIVINNQPTNDAIGRGGGVYLKEGDITLDHSKIHNNRSNYYGGGIYCLGTISASTVDLIGSEVKSNIADRQGGGIYLHEGFINIKTSTIGGSSYADANVAGTSNSDYKGGGIYTQTGNVNITDSNISYNLANRRGGGIYTKSGPVTIKSSVISYNQAGYRKNTPEGNVVPGNAYGTGGGIHTDGGLVTINPNEDEATQTEIKNNKARLNGGGIFTGTEGTGSAATKGKVAVYGNREGEGGHLINIRDNEAVNGSGGGIFCLGDSDGQRYVLLRRVNLSNNKATNGGGTQPSETGTVTSGCGGGLYLQQGLIDMNLCTVEGNTAKLNGGGVNNHQGNINVQSCYIRNNVAGNGNTDDAGSGGGIYTHTGTIGINYWGTPATIQNEDRRTEITGNTAKLNGGGLNTHNGKILVHGNSDASTDRILINNNTATKGSGGGIFCMGQPASGSVHTNFITLQHVDMKLNKALSGSGTYTDTDNSETVSKGCGGAVYLQLGELKATDVVMQNNLANKNGGAINNHDGFVDIFGCVIGGEDYYDGSTLNGRGNKANNSGGGIYTNKGDIDVEDYIEHGQGSSKRYESKLSYNEAVENGGALDTHSGIIYVNRNERDDETEITYNKAKKGGGIYANEGTIFVNNTRVDNNIATENGGGVNNHAGDITFRGGTLNNNTAQKGRGGGAFTYVGDINILPFPSTKTSPTRDDGTKIFNNLAQINGGGINNHTGRVDIRHAALRNNTATLGNGGGIFCEGPHSNSTGYTIRLLNSELMENKTRGQDGTPDDPTGRGGGIYLKYGSIYAHSSDIIENFANVNGGGLDNYDGSILVYGCNIIGNEAVTGRGGGIYTQTGNITTGPASSKASVIHSNIAKINGGGINNHQGDIFLNGDLIFNNEAGSCGGGIYIKNGTIEMYGGKIANNTAGVDGGGVWSGGGTFAIQQRVGKPVVDIIDVNVVSGTQAIVHYHIIDNGSGTISSSGHGILYGSSEDAVAAATGAVSGSVYSINSGQEQGADAGCYRITINDSEHFTAGGTYYVKAFTTNSTSLTDYSDVMSFTTYGTLPVVISGTTANITKNSAEGSGKLLYSNGANICGVCYIQKDGNLTSLSDLEVGKTGVEKKVDTLSSGTFPNEHFFTYTLTPLANGKKYFARAYASNDGGSTYTYGDTVSFVTLKDTPEMTGELSVTSMVLNSATGKYDVSFKYTMDASSFTAYGFGISSENNPQLVPENIVGGTAVAATETVPAHFVGTKVGLDPGTACYVRAFASTAEEEGGENPALDITNYTLTEPLPFFTPDANGLPVVRLLSLSNITQNSVTYTAKLIDQGSGAITRYGLCYSTSNMLPTEHGTECDHDEHDGTLAVGQEFTFTITGLELNQTYYLRAYATNKELPTPPNELSDDDYGYSNEFSFSTLPAEVPFVLITTVDPIGQTTATVNCSVNDGGGGNITDWGIKYSNTPDITNAIDINKPGDPLSGNTFSADLPKTGETALTKNTDYYLWAYATNSVGTHTTSHYVRFRTAYDNPTVTDVTVSEIDYNANATSGQQNTARFVATATPTGTPTTNIKTRGVCWSTNQDPVRMMSDYTDSQFIEATDNDGWAAAQTIDYAGRIQKYPNTRYYVRAYASVNTPDADNNLEDIIYSSTQTVFTTLPAMQTDAVSDITDVSATLGGTILSRDINGYLSGGTYGVCWGTSPNPTKGTGNYVEETITGSYGNTRPYTLNATGLTPNTTYYYRAYYDRGSEIAYGKQAENTFTTKAYHLIVNYSPADGGTVTPTYVGMNAGETVSVTATANLGYSFNEWTLTGGGTGTGANAPTIGNSTATTTTFKMGSPGANAILTANFSHTEYTITVQASPAEGGTVTGGGSTFHYGDATTLSATANTGYDFLYWTLNGEIVSEDPDDFPITVTGNATYVANFEYNGRGRGASTAPATPRPRDIYPAPAREPWDWDEELEGGVGDTIRDGDSPVLPKVTTGDITVINADEATCTGKVTTNGSGTITKYGVCWGTSINPTISDNKTEVTVTTEVAPFDIAAQTMSGLEGSVPYYVRAYATDENGTAYGANKVLIISDPVSIPSIDHNVAEQGRGGGIFLNRKDKNDPAYPKCDSAVLIFSDGKINYNYAKVSGGGIHIDTSAYMQMKGICEVNANRVNLGSLGGGIYQAGRLYVGEFLNDVESTHTLRINKNFAIGTADNDGGLITNYKAIVAFSVSDKDLAIACNKTSTQLLELTLGASITVGENTTTVLNQLLLLANNITAETGIVAQDIVDALADVADVSALEALTVANYNAKKAGLLADAAETLNNIYLPRDSYDFEDHQAYGTYDDHSSVIVVLSNLSAKNTITEANNVQYPYTNLGFSVPHGYCPVIATSDGFGNKYMNTQQITGQNPEFENLLNLLMPVGTLSLKDCAVFEDSDSYIAIHTRKNNDPFLGKYIYLWGSWTNPKVGEDPEIATGSNNLMGRHDSHRHYQIDYIDNPLATGDEDKKIAVWEILSEEGLSWFSSYVNGLNIFNPVEGGDEYHKKYDPQVNPYAKAKLMNDLDMRDALWVPIGSVTFYHGPSGDGGIYSDENHRSFKGEFDGQGHLVTGLDCRYLSGIQNYGFFGRLEGDAKVKNLFIDDSKFHTISDEIGYCVGGVSGQMSGNAIVSASEARSDINVVESKKDETYVGGIAGKVEKLTTDPAGAKVVIHSSMAMPNISGSAKYVGGLVGYLGNGNKLFNSFSNSNFPDETYKDTLKDGSGTVTDQFYFGGLVGVNNGVVENCYSRLQGNEPKGVSNNASIFGWLAGTNTVTASASTEGGIRFSYTPEGKNTYVKNPTSGSDKAPFGHGQYGSTALYSGKYGFKHRDQQMFDKDGKSIDDDESYEEESYTKYLQHTITNDTLIVGGLTNALNAWVDTANKTTKTYHPWMRTMASPINDDYPIPNFLNQSATTPTELSDNDDPLWNCVGSIDKVFMIYDIDVNDLYHVKQMDTVKPVNHPHAAMYLYNTNGINPNASTPVTEAVPVTITNNARVPLYIHEDVGITQPKDSVLTARVGVTFDNSNRSILPELGGQPYDWHMFSSALNEPAMGLRYHTIDEVNDPLNLNYVYYKVWENYSTYLANGIPNGVYNGQVPDYQRENMDPPRTYFYQSDNSDKKGFTTDKTKFGYFPANTPYGTWRNKNAAQVASEDGFTTGSFDFYMYGEAYYQHWINFKRRGDADFYDHWRQDPIDNGNHLNIPYTNETDMVNGRGYMMGVSQRSMLMADGTLNNEVSGDNGAITYNATFTVDPSATVYDALVRGTNLVGNPYQSFLDMNKFLSGNSVGGIYYIFDADKADANGNLYLAYPQSGSYNPEYAPKILHPHQGFFVKVSSNNTPIKFTNEMRVAGKWTSSLAANDDLKGSYFRENVNYPLVNLSCFDSDGKRDLTTVEINRPELGGGLKMKRLHMGNAILYAHMEGGDYQALFAPEGISEVPVRFEAFEDDVFTMRWSTLHGDFHYLHLIDNMTGSDIDMLRATEYHFEGKTTDYKSRFKLVFEVTGLEEEDDNEDDNGSTINFAFRMGDEIIVNGEGYFELFDVQGRRLTAKQLAGSQSSVSLPNVAAGVYLLRLTGDKQVKTQKMVISY